MALPTSYKVGTISVSANGTIVTGTGTNWITAGLREGDVFTTRGLSVSVASVNSAELPDSAPGPGVIVGSRDRDGHLVSL